MQKSIKIFFGTIALLYLIGTSYQMYLFLNYQSHKEKVTEEHCINKDKPEMHCNGKCHLRKQLKAVPVQASLETENTNVKPRLTLVSFDFYQDINFIGLEFVNTQKDQVSLEHNSHYSFRYTVYSFQPPEII